MAKLEICTLPNNGSMIYFFYCTTTGVSSQQLIQSFTNFWRFCYSTHFPFSLAWTSHSKIIIAAFSNEFLCTNRKSNWHSNQWANKLFHIDICRDTIHGPQERVVRGPKPEKFPPKYILIKRACQTQIETEGFLTVFRHRDNTQTSAGYFLTAATGNVVSWCPHQLEEEVMVW